MSRCSKSRPFYYDCECDSNIDVLQMIKTAMRNEKKAVKFYCYMMEKSECEADREMFKEIRNDEKKHYRWLQEIYRELTCECYCVNNVEVKRPKGFCRAMKAAICNEMQAISDYEVLASYLCEMRHKEVICAIIAEERCHAQRIAALYQFAQECACRCNQNNKHNCSCQNHCNSGCNNDCRYYVCYENNCCCENQNHCDYECDYECDYNCNHDDCDYDDDDDCGCND